MLDAGGVLDKYVDSSFDGGAPGMFYYISTPGAGNPQAYLVCVSFGEPTINIVGDNLGGYCTGNGFGSTDDGGVFTDPVAAAVTKKSMEEADWDAMLGVFGGGTGTNTSVSISEWHGSSWDPAP